MQIKKSLFGSPEVLKERSSHRVALQQQVADLEQEAQEAAQKAQEAAQKAQADVNAVTTVSAQLAAATRDLGDARAATELERERSMSLQVGSAAWQSETFMFLSCMSLLLCGPSVWSHFYCYCSRCNRD